MVVDSNFRGVESVALSLLWAAPRASEGGVARLALYEFSLVSASAHYACRLMHTGQYTEAEGPDSIFTPLIIPGIVLDGLERPF